MAADCHTYVDLSTLRGNDLRTDLAARDFTFNAMALRLADVSQQQVIDLFGGRDDLRRRRVCAVSDHALSDDPARLVRAVRFSAELGFEIDKHTAALAQRSAPLLAGVAAERVRDEFARILHAPGAWRNLHLLDDLGLLCVILPELNAMKGVAQSQHYYDVFTHTLAVADAVEETLIACGVAQVDKRPAGPPHPPLPVAVLGPVATDVRLHLAEVVSADRTRLVALKLGALLHDVAKPRTRTMEGEETHFYNHPVEGVAMAEEAMRRLRFSVNEIRIVSTMVLNHMRPAQVAADPQSTKKAVYRYFRDTGPEGVDTLLLSLADHIGTRGPTLNPSAWWQHAQFTRLMLEYYYAPASGPLVQPKLITGKDVMRICGLPAGPQVGDLLAEVQEAQALGEVTTRSEALQFVVERWEQWSATQGGISGPAGEA